MAGRVGGGGAGAVCDLAPDYRLGVGPVSSKWWGDGVRKKGEENNTNIQPLASFFTTISASAGGIGGFPARSFCRKSDKTVYRSSSWEFRKPVAEWSVVPSARVGDVGRGSADGTKTKRSDGSRKFTSGLAPGQRESDKNARRSPARGNCIFVSLARWGRRFKKTIATETTKTIQSVQQD